MDFPLVNKEIISSLRLAHGAFNFLVMLLFWYQAWIGMRIRKARRLQGGILPFTLIRRHRKSGPVFVGMTVFGYLFGILIVLLNKGHLLEHPVHFGVGTVLIAAVAASFVLSRRIMGQQSRYRNAHFVSGILVLLFYFLQVLIGIGVLF